VSRQTAWALLRVKRPAGSRGGGSYLNASEAASPNRRAVRLNQVLMRNELNWEAVVVDAYDKMQKLAALPFEVAVDIVGGAVA
jgi:hypothetical protein